MQSLLLLLLSSTKAIKVTKVSSSTKVTFILFLFSTTTRVTLTDDPGIPSVKYNLQLGDLTVKTELSTNNNNNSGQTKVSDSDEKDILKEQEDNSTTSQDDNKGSSELRRWREKRVWEKMAASKTWDAMKSAWLKSSLSGKTGEDDLEFSPDESLKFSKEKLPENKTKDDNKVEERLYPATMMACTEKVVKGKLTVADMEQGFKLLFIRLFSYLKGDNGKKERLEMTAPVFAMTHLDSSYRPDRIGMCFWLTQDVESLVPEPLASSTVFLWRMEPTKFLVRRFSGPGGEDQREVWSKEAERLAESLKTLGLLEKTDRRLLVFSSYQAPWQKKDRRDEVLLRIMEGSKDWQTPFKQDFGHNHGM